MSVDMSSAAYDFISAATCTMCQRVGGLYLHGSIDQCVRCRHCDLDTFCRRILAKHLAPLFVEELTEIALDTDEIQFTTLSEDQQVSVHPIHVLLGQHWEKLIEDKESLESVIVVLLDDDTFQESAELIDPDCLHLPPILEDQTAATLQWALRVDSNYWVQETVRNLSREYSPQQDQFITPADKDFTSTHYFSIE